MTEDEHIQRHIDLVQQIYERLVAEGKWEEVSKQFSAKVEKSSPSSEG